MLSYFNVDKIYGDFNYDETGLNIYYFVDIDTWPILLEWVK